MRTFTRWLQWLKPGGRRCSRTHINRQRFLGRLQEEPVAPPEVQTPPCLAFRKAGLIFLMETLPNVLATVEAVFAVQDKHPEAALGAGSRPPPLANPHSNPVGPVDGLAHSPLKIDIHNPGVVQSDLTDVKEVRMGKRRVQDANLVCLAVLLTFVCLLLCPRPGAAQVPSGLKPGCVNDMQCKGERICDSGKCVYPRRQEVGQSACLQAREADSEAAWRQYVVRFPDGACAGEAAVEINRLAEAAAEKQRDERACRDTRARNTVQAWYDYLAEHPAGQCSSEARRLLGDYEARRAREAAILAHLRPLFMIGSEAIQRPAPDSQILRLHKRICSVEPKSVEGQYRGKEFLVVANLPDGNQVILTRHRVGALNLDKFPPAWTIEWHIQRYCP